MDKLLQIDNDCKSAGAVCPRAADLTIGIVVPKLRRRLDEPCVSLLRGL